MEESGSATVALSANSPVSLSLSVLEAARFNLRTSATSSPIRLAMRLTDSLGWARVFTAAARATSAAVATASSASSASS